MTLTIGIDIGGTKVLAGVVDEDGRILATERRATPSADRGALLERVTDAVAALRSEYDVEAIGVSAAGFVDAARSSVVFAPNLPLVGEALAVELRARCGLPTVVENDANAAAWGEYRYGGGHGDDTVCVTVGTGVGGGIVLDGRLLRGHWGFAAEIGHVRVVPGGRPCGCGQRGCWEQYASGQALVSQARELATADPAGASVLLALGDGTPDGIQGPQVTAAALAGDPVAVQTFEIIGGWVGEGLASFAALLDPAVFVVGGGVSEAGDLLLEPARRSYAEALTGNAFRPIAEIRPAELGNEAGLVGAADLARR